MEQKSAPIMLRKFSFEKANLSTLKVFAGLDRGCSLTKIIYVDQADSDSLKEESKSNFISLTVALFHNSKFEDALIWLKEKAYFPENKEYPFHLTGAGGVKYSEKIKEILERDVLFIDEFMAQSRGAYQLIKNVPIEEIVYPKIEVDCEHWFNIPLITDVKLQFEEAVGKRKDIKSVEDLLPCVFGFMGSGGGFTYIGADGTFRMVSGLPSAGKTFIGLCRCILGTNDYNEILKMASRGDRRKVDLQIKDIWSSDNEFGSLSKDLPIMHLGQLADTDKSISEFNKDDIAHSLVSMFIYNSVNAAIQVCMTEKVHNVFFGGNLFQGEIFRKEFSVLQKLYGIDYVNFFFLNNGHTAALGAMISLPEHMDTFFQT